MASVTTCGGLFVTTGFNKFIMEKNFGSSIISGFGEIFGFLTSTLILMSIVATIWLLVVGEWRLILLGLFVGFVFPYLDTLLMLPAIGVMALVTTKLKKLFAISFLLTLVTIAYQQIIMVAWSFFVISYIASLSGHYILSTLFGLSVVMSPLTYMARGEDGLGTIIGLLVAFVSYIIFSVVTLTAMPIFLLLIPMLLIVSIWIQGAAMFTVLKINAKEAV